MLKCASVFTFEMDDYEIAASEIKAQLNKIVLLENTIGIVMCHTEFISSGVLKYICESLPFDVVGITTSSQAVNDEMGELILTIFVMTADDVQFKTGVTTCLLEGIEQPARLAYGQASDGMPSPVKLAMVFPPRIIKYAGDSYVNAWESIMPGVPIFGAAATDDTVTFSECETIYHGMNYKTCMPFVLCYGNIHPRFMVGALPEDNTMPYKAEVTKSNGSFVYEINNQSAYQYFENLGLARDGVATDNFLFIPFLIDQKNREDYDGIPVMRVLNAFTQDGAASFRGYVDENSTISMLKCMPDNVLASTRQKISDINALTDVHGVLLLPCIIRRMVVMGVDPLLELNNVKETIHPEIPFMMGYAGGEICPTSVKNGLPVNRFHNYSLIILVV